jgi:hypothetical protein
MMELIPKLICLEESTNIFKLLMEAPLEEMQALPEEMQALPEDQVQVQVVNNTLHGNTLLLALSNNSQKLLMISKQLLSGSKTLSNKMVLIPLNSLI